MKNRVWKLGVGLVLVLLVMTACTKKDEYPVVQSEAQNIQQQLAPESASAESSENYGEYSNDGYMPEQSGESVFSENPFDDPAIQLNAGSGIATNLGYDPTIEENIQLENYQSQSSAGGVSLPVAEPVGYQYAGTTPIPLDPIDMPARTPVPVNIVYMPYSIALGLSFEAPSGWMVDESVNEVFVLTEPSSQIKDNYLAAITITAIPVNSNMSQKELETEVKGRLESISETNYKEWRPSYTATRYLLGEKGVYANYRGEMIDGVEVGGRIHYVCVDRMMYGLEITYPLAYKTVFEDVFSKIRETLSIIK